MARAQPLLSRKRPLVSDFPKSHDEKRFRRAGPKHVANAAPQSLSDDEDLDDEPEFGSNQDDEEEDDVSESMSSEAEGTDEEEREAMRNISFGALVDAQDELEEDDLDEGQPREDLAKTTPTDREDKLQALRDRLAELRESKQKQTAKGSTSHKKSKRKRPHGSSDSDADSDSGPEETGRPAARSSKHAPAEQSSRHQVTRRRTVVDTAGHLPPSSASGAPGDPRFSAAAGALDKDRVQARYAFLDDYAAQELSDMKQRLADGSRPRNKQRGRGGAAPALTPAEQAALRVEIGRAENRARARARRARERDVLREHNRRERERVRDGKKPFFLKKGEARKRVEQEAWDGMKAKERSKAEARRRKRAEGKELRNKPGERRSFAG